MALFDFLKRKKEVEKAKDTRKEDKKFVKKTDPVLVEKEKTTASVSPSAKNILAKKFNFETIKNPHISEKAGYLSEKEQYTFKVSSRFNKKEIKKAVEGLYGVNVISVNLIKIPAKKRRIGKTQGFKKGYIKAVVKIKQGQKIEIL
jgi:large subunit ribosomal protein L23